MEINPAELSLRDMNKILIGSVVPRPIAWVSSVNAGGAANLAPFSFFNAVCTKPPTLLFCPGIRGSDAGTKDTLHNIRAMREYVINIATEETAEAMNVTATELPANVDEFALAGLTAVKSAVVKPPRVAESPINFECKLTQIVDIGDGGVGSASIVIGEVVHVHVADRVLFDEYKINIAELKPIARLGGFGYARITDTFEMKRLPSQVPSKQ
jgi:flavin reductase (DIM6/NTAB) family NADH-FMN oxidoreductase RutF